MGRQGRVERIEGLDRGRKSPSILRGQGESGNRTTELGSGRGVVGSGEGLVDLKEIISVGRGGLRLGKKTGSRVSWGLQAIDSQVLDFPLSVQ